MQKADSLPGRLFGVVFLLPAALVVAADQFTKAWVWRWVESHPGEHVIWQLGFVRLTHVENTGAAFGLFQGQSLVLTIVVSLGIVVLLAVGFIVRRRHPYLMTGRHVVAFGIMLGGSVGNLIDRLVREGRVTDFVDIGLWPAFNVADSAIVVGSIILAFSLLRSGLREGRRAA